MDFKRPEWVPAWAPDWAWKAAFATGAVLFAIFMYRIFAELVLFGLVLVALGVMGGVAYYAYQWWQEQESAEKSVKGADTPKSPEI